MTDQPEAEPETTAPEELPPVIRGEWRIPRYHKLREDRVVTEPEKLGGYPDGETDSWAG